MHTRTQAVRLYRDDHASLQVIAGIEQRKPADVVHQALLDYVRNHQQRLSAVFSDTQAAVAAGDFDALSEIAKRSAQDRANAAVRRNRGDRASDDADEAI